MVDAGLRCYKNVVFDAVKTDVTNSILTLINSEREHNVINKDLIKACIQVYETMGMGTLDTYNNDFEAPLLESTK